MKNSWRICAHCGEEVSLPNGDAPGEYHYPIPGVPREMLRGANLLAGVLLHHKCLDAYRKEQEDKPDSF